MTVGRTGTAVVGRHGVRVAALLLLAAGAGGGCINQPTVLPANKQLPLDRKVVEYPAGTQLVPLMRGLNSPTAMCLEGENLIVAESGIDACEPHVFGVHLPDGKTFEIYPFGRTVSVSPTGFVLYGPIGGMVAVGHQIYVSHRDRDGFGVITALGYDGRHKTIAAGLPARGDYGVTDLVLRRDGRVLFGVGAATNSGVVGLDNYETWARRYPDVHDEVYTPNEMPLKPLGPRFDSPNPAAGLGQPDILVTPPFLPLNGRNQSSIRPSAKPNSAIYSVKVDGGDLRVEAFGIRNPRGLALRYDRLYATNDGMELRGTRPVANDPDVLIQVPPRVWFGADDYTTNGLPVSDPAFRPPLNLIAGSGYDELRFLIDHDGSGLQLPDFNVLLGGVFPSQSGAAKMAFVPGVGPLKDQEGKAVVALDGDRGPFATGYQTLQFHPGRKIALVDVDSKTVTDLVKNTVDLPASQQPYGTVALERPCDVKFAADGTLYILDFGRMDNDGPVPRYYPGSGAIFKLQTAR